MNKIKLVILRMIACILVVIITTTIFIFPFIYNVIKYILTGKFNFFAIVERWFDRVDELFTRLSEK